MDLLLWKYKVASGVMVLFPPEDGLETSKRSDDHSIKIVFILCL